MHNFINKTYIGKLDQCFKRSDVDYCFTLLEALRAVI